MGPELQQPYTTEEIQKRPVAVTISVLIGLLLLSVGFNIKNNSDKETRIRELTDKADEEKAKRIEQYEAMIFYKDAKERLEETASQSDSLIRERTQPLVKRILKTKTP